MTGKIFRSIVSVAAVVLAASTVVILGILYEYFGSIQEASLRDQLSFAAAGVELEGEAYLTRLHPDGCRLTWIEEDGEVVYDTQYDAQSLENHAGRVEVDEALRTGSGMSTRYSSTLLEKTSYYALRLRDGSVLRISASRQTVAVLALGMLQPVLVVMLAALILSGVLAKRIARRLVMPLNALDLDRPLENEAYEELAPLLRRIHSQRAEIDAQLHALRRRADEFAQVTGSMREGLVLLDSGGAVLSINAAARQLFSTDVSCVGADFFTLARSDELRPALADAAENGHSEFRSEHDGRIYQFDISRIVSDGAAGTVILAFDITEQANAERTRREFSANVSHELKTPLQGIIGSAELIEKGMVKPEDLPRFAGHIHNEAVRLVTLINDILRLSQLDEEAALPVVQVDLLAEAQEVAARLRSEAGAKNVSLRVEGEHACMQGAQRLINEILYNLCDNAIKYNRKGGSVTIHTAREEGACSVTVSDTGIGIAPAHQQRIFERFYRVDKSHSKASGGTGLGLSIVKHAVEYHHGSISLESEPGRGTRICVRFPT